MKTALHIVVRAGLFVRLLTLALQAQAQIDCLGVDGGTALPGTPCDDGIPFTYDDLWYPSCYCHGQCEPIGGDPCDDGNPNTINDIMTACGCSGTCWAAPGEPCDDANPWTSSDMMWPMCNCQGICDSPPGTLCDDGNPLTTGEFLNAYCQCVGGSNLISGNVFLDLDMDGLFGGGDLPLAGRRVDAGPNRYAVTNNQGDFFIVVPSGNYPLTVSPGPFEVQAQAPPMVNVVGEGLISPGHSLAMNATSLEPDLAVGTWQNTPRPGFMSWATVFSRNWGTTATDGTMSLTFDPQQNFVSSDGVLAGNTVTWNLTAVQPGQWVYRTVILMTPPGVPLGTLLSQSAHVAATPPDAVPANDDKTVSPIVGGSWDPNDKTVTPALLTADDLTAGRSVEYLIRFQNTGSFLAEDVRITDQLPAGVDPSTFEFLGSSHPCHTNYRDGVLEFLFDGIMLPDSNANEPESHGFVLFTVKPSSTLLPGDSIWNRAYIYFDFNEPVVTNAATFRIELNTAVPLSADPVSTISLWPNPATDLLNISVNEPEESVRASIIDLNGRVVRRIDCVVVNGALAIPLAGLADGLYTMRMESLGQVRNNCFVKIH